MKIAVLGKGGSGKSTMATALVRQLRSRGMRVLAIDADYNMDLAYSLDSDPSTFLGSDPEYIKEYVGTRRSSTYGEALRQAREMNICFTLFPADAYTDTVSKKLEDGLRLMTAGPHTDRVRSQEFCSHSLTAPLKVYLPQLVLKEDEYVVIDERAGTDPVATGILPNVNLAVIVQEPTINSRRVAGQIGIELKLAGIPHMVVENKIAGIENDTMRAVKAILTSGK